MHHARQAGQLGIEMESVATGSLAVAMNTAPMFNTWLGPMAWEQFVAAGRTLVREMQVGEWWVGQSRV